MTGTNILLKLLATGAIRLEAGEYIGKTLTGEVLLGSIDNMQSLFKYLIDHPSPATW